MKVKTLNKTKSNNSEVVIKDEIFGIDPNEGVILRGLNCQLAKKKVFSILFCSYLVFMAFHRRWAYTILSAFNYLMMSYSMAFNNV